MCEPVEDELELRLERGEPAVDLRIQRGDLLIDLVDAIPEARLPEAEQMLHGLNPTEPAAEPRVFASAGTLSAEHDLAERSEDILRSNA